MSTLRTIRGITAALSSVRERCEFEAEVATLDATTEAIAEVFAEQMATFDKQRFLHDAKHSHA
jgi:hypothetical protein